MVDRDINRFQDFIDKHYWESQTDISGDAEELEKQRAVLAKVQDSIDAYNADQEALSALSNKVVLSDVPILYVTKAGYDADGLPNEYGNLGQPYTENNFKNILAMLMGLGDPLNNYADWSYNETMFETPPKLITKAHMQVQPLVWDRRFTSDDSTNQYNGAPVTYAYVALKNSDVSNDIDVSVTARGTSYSNYCGFGISSTVPNKTNIQIAGGDLVDSWSWLSEYSTTSNSANISRTEVVTVPAGKTMLLRFHAGDRFDQTITGAHYFLRMLVLQNLKDWISNANISWDYNVMQNLANRGFTGNATLYDIWNVTAKDYELTKVSSGTVPEYADNASAVAAGLAVGQLYTNSTTKALTVVVE